LAAPLPLHLPIRTIPNSRGTPSMISKIDSVNKEFLDRAMPELISWGLSKHPNPVAYFGRSEHGYRYDFSDIRELQDIKIASFAIIRPNSELWIKGYRYKGLSAEPEKIPILFDTIDGIFTLTRKMTISRIFKGGGFSLRRYENSQKKDPPKLLMNEVLGRLWKLRRYLYGNS